MKYTANSAEISTDRVYRYLLTRSWGYLIPSCTFICLNPSTADGTQDDPTVRRCVDFADAWGFDRMRIVNLFALRATNPRELINHDDPIGPRNNDWLRAIAGEVGLVVAAWGCIGGLSKIERRDRYVMSLFQEKTMMCFGTTKDGSPRHPLYLKRNTRLVPFVGRSP